MSQPEALRSSPWSLAELAGQKKLLVLGALLAWIVLFHLLVNVWLLCMFTSLLIVMGGWLGSQAVLDTSSVVHLERFIKLERCAPSPESESQLDEEIKSTVSKIIRDFVSSWYRTVSREPEFETEVQNAMQSMALELKMRARSVDRKALAQKSMVLFGCHLQSYMRVKEVIAELDKQPGGDDRYNQGSLWKLYSKVSSPHQALKSSAMEVNYARAIVDLLLHALAPAPHLETRTGRYVVGELITCNVLLPLITKVSDPAWLNAMIVDVLTKSVIKVKPTPSPSPLPPPPPPPQEPQLEVPSSLPLKIYLETPTSEAPTPKSLDYSSCDLIDHAEACPQQEKDEEESKQDIEVFTGGKIVTDYLRPDAFNPFYPCDDSDLESPMADFRKSSECLVLTKETLQSDRLRDCVTPTEFSSAPDLEEAVRSDHTSSEESIREPVEQNLEVQVKNEADLSGAKEESPTSIAGLGNFLCEEPDRIPSRQPFFQGKEALASEHAGSSNPQELSLAVPMLTSSSSTGIVNLSTFSFEPLSSPDGPVIIQNLRITGTITAKEHRGTGSHPYTLYTVKYETAVDAENPGTLQPVAYHMVNRRYSEFLNLQTRMEEKTELRKLIKNVKGPKKIFPDLPFGNMDSDKVEARKGLLESFLKQLCAIPETANSEEMQEFLALNTDARIAFVKKPFIVSRIDKIVVNAIVDTLKTAFPRSEPQSPTEDIAENETGESKPVPDCKKNKSRLRFSSKIAPVFNESELQPKVLYCFGEGSTVFDGLSLAGVADFIQEQERLLEMGTQVERDGKTHLSGGEDGEPQQPEEQRKSAAAETDLADVALNLLCLLMKDQWSWLCTENIQKTIRLLFGTLIERWLEVHIANLTSTPYWVTYLRVLQEAIWPGGSLPTRPRLIPTPEQKEEMRNRCLECLMKLVPDFVPEVLGVEKYKMSWQVVLESLQDPHINRHLVYCMCDLLLEFLVPESSNEDFQKSLFKHLSGNTAA